MAKCEQEEKKELIAIDIDGQSYSLLKRPPVTSMLVNKSRSTILMTLDVGVFTTELNRVERFIQIAYNGLAMRPVLQGKVINLAIEITQLADKSALSLVEFGLASDSVLSALEYTYWYIYNDKERLAKGSFASIGRVAGNMADIAMKLHKSYNEVKNEVKNLISESYSAMQSEKDKKIDLTLLQQNFTARLNRAQKISEDALTAYKKYEGLFHDARKRERKAINAQTNPLKKLANAFTSKFGFGESYDFGAYKNAEDAYRAEKYKYLENMESFRKLQAEASADFVEFAQRIKNCKNNKELAEITINALTKTAGGLAVISRAMLNAANFWEQISVHCNNLKELGSVVADEFDSLMQESNITERRKMWRSYPFMDKAMKLYGWWSAIGSISYDTAKELKGPRNKLRERITEVRSEEESLKIIHSLAADFEEEMKRETALLDEQGRENREAMKEYQNNEDQEHDEL